MKNEHTKTMKKVHPFSLETGREYFNDEGKSWGTFVKYTDQANPIFDAGKHLQIVDKSNGFYARTAPHWVRIAGVVVFTTLFVNLLMVDIDKLTAKQCWAWYAGFILLALAAYMVYGDRKNNEQ